MDPSHGGAAAIAGARARLRLPRATAAWYFLVVLSIAAMGFGLYAYYQQLARGDIVTGLRNPGYGGGAWGLYIAFYVYFVGVSFAGVTVAATARLLHIDILKPVSRMAELLTVVSLVAAAGMVLVDLGRPVDGILKLPMLARPSSPFYGTFTLVVSGYLFSSLVYLFVSGRHDAARLARGRHLPPLSSMYRLWASGYRGTAPEHARHGRTTFWLSITIVPLLVVAHSTLGFIFGIQSGRPGWYSALQAPAFVVLAGVSGTGALILFAIAFRRLFRLDFPDAPLHWLGNLLWILALCYLYLMTVEEVTGTYAAPEGDRRLIHEVVHGHFAPQFWFMVGCMLLTFLIPFVLYLARSASLRWLVVAAVLSNLGAITKRLLIVVPSQTHGALFPIERGTYSPTWVEWGVVVGMAGFLLFALLVFGKFFPLIPSKRPPLSRAHPIPRERLRTAVTVAWALSSLTIAAIGLAGSFGPLDGRGADSWIPFSPSLFATGVIALFLTAVVYEAFPSFTRAPKWTRRASRRSIRSTLRLPGRRAVPNAPVRAVPRPPPLRFVTATGPGHTVDPGTEG